MTDRWIAWAGLALVLQAGAAHAQWKDWDYELDQEKKPWAEMQLKLPAYPRPENLLKFDVGSNTGNNYFIDAASLSVGEDDVVRYTLVVKTSGGATNVSFEGVRCSPRQVRIYAFGHPGAEWARARDANWQEVEYREVNGYRHILVKDYFCNFGWNSEPRIQKDILARLKTGVAYVDGKPGGS